MLPPSAVLLSIKSQRTLSVAPPVDGNLQYSSDLLLAILEMCKKKSRALWDITDDVKADVVFVPYSPDDHRVNRWRDNGQIVVPIFNNGSDPRSDSLFTLQSPLRFMPVLDLLDDIDVAMSASVETPAVKSPTIDLWYLPQKLRVLRQTQQIQQSQQDNSWFQFLGNNGLAFWVSANASIYAADAELCSQLRSGALHHVSWTFSAATAPPSHLPIKPALELLWFSCIHSSKASESLAPWLGQHQYYKLQRWPDLSMLKTTPIFIKLLSTLSVEAFSIDGLVKRTGMTRVDVLSVINALSGCNLLSVTEKPKQVQTIVETIALETQDDTLSDKKKSQSTLQGLYKNIRKHFGL